MQIGEAKVYNFGKLEKREFAFAPGINVIYGANEAGKSTLHRFLVAMLFGMEKGRGRGLKDDYQRYEPWHAPAYYSGALRFQVDGRPFYLERNFYHKEKREILRNEADGEELSVVYGDLAMLLGGIDKETFGNTYDIPQAGAVTGRELTSMLAEYLSDAAESGDRSIHVAKAKEILLAKKKTLSADLKKLQEEKPDEDLFQKMGFVMAKFYELKASRKEMAKLNEDAYLDWLEQFEYADYVAAVGDIAEVYEGQTVSTSQEKKEES